MTQVFYHRTSILEARRTVEAGFRDEHWSFGVRGSRTGEDHEVDGVWLTERPLGAFEGPPGDAQLEVSVDLSEATLAPFELVEVFHDVRLWVVPAELLNHHATARISEVDPNTSSQFEFKPD